MDAPIDRIAIISGGEEGKFVTVEVYREGIDVVLSTHFSGDDPAEVTDEVMDHVSPLVHGMLEN